MRFVYFLVSSSLLISLVLLIRKVFRKQLSPGVIYALWLIPMLRLMIPFGSWEFPVFGAMADFLNAPYDIVAEWLDREEESEVSEAAATMLERRKEQLTNEQNMPGTKIYDAVVPETEPTIESAWMKREKDATSSEPVYVWILAGIWLSGIVLTGSYTIAQNKKLKNKLQTISVMTEVEGLKVCVSSEAKASCLVGMINPKILLTEEVFKDEKLYQCVLQHELAHYRQKDHIWNTIRILLCVIYWWNPFVRFAARCVEEDTELACDARVLENQPVEVRKAYGYALLQMLENAQDKSHPMVMATSMSGTRSSMKRRIEEISQKTTTKGCVVLPSILILTTTLVIGCGIPTDKSWIRTGEWDMGDTGEMLYTESAYEYSLKGNLESQLIYYEIYEYGELKKRTVLGAGEIENFASAVKLRHEVSKTSDESRFIMEIDGIGIEMDFPLSAYPDSGGQSFAALQSDEKIEIVPEKSLILTADYRTENGAIQTYDCGVLSDYTDAELKEALKENYVVGFCRIVFSEMPTKELYEKYSRMEASEKNDSQSFVTAWAEAFVDRDAETIRGMASEEAYEQLKVNGLMGEEEDYIYFGWSSPWPMFTKQLYEILQCDDSKAVIRYYAGFSIPDVYVWEEILELEKVNGAYRTVSESIHYFDAICTIEEFYRAYPEGKIAGTMMDYTVNGLGEALNKNALLSSSTEYHALFDPITAAADLLNLSINEELVYFSSQDLGRETTVQIHFLNEDGKTDVAEVTMWQPYGENGIWIPK